MTPFIKVSRSGPSLPGETLKELKYLEYLLTEKTPLENAEVVKATGPIPESRRKL